MFLPLSHSINLWIFNSIYIFGWENVRRNQSKLWTTWSSNIFTHFLFCAQLDFLACFPSKNMNPIALTDIASFSLKKQQTYLRLRQQLCINIHLKQVFISTIIGSSAVHWIETSVWLSMVLLSFILLWLLYILTSFSGT